MFMSRPDPHRTLKRLCVVSTRNEKTCLRRLDVGFFFENERFLHGWAKRGGSKMVLKNNYDFSRLTVLNRVLDPLTVLVTTGWHSDPTSMRLRFNSVDLVRRFLQDIQFDHFDVCGTRTCGTHFNVGLQCGYLKGT